MSKHSISDQQIEAFLNKISGKLQELGGKSDDLKHFFNAPNNRYYEEATNLIAQNTVWLTPKPKPDTDLFVDLQIDYNPFILPERIATYCREVHGHLVRNLEDQPDPACIRQEHVQFEGLHEQLPAKSIREDAAARGLKSCTGQHAVSILKRCQEDSNFKRRIMPFLPLYFLGATYSADHCAGAGYPVSRVNVYLCLGLPDESAISRTPNEDTPIVWRTHDTRSHFYRGYCAVY